MSTKKTSWEHIDAENFLANDTREMTLFLLWCQEQGWLSYPAGHFAMYQNVAAVRDSMRLLRDAPALVDRCVALGLCRRPGNYVPPVPHNYCSESEEGEHAWNTFGRCNHCGRDATRAALRRNTKPLAEPIIEQEVTEVTEVTEEEAA